MPAELNGVHQRLDAVQGWITTLGRETHDTLGDIPALFLASESTTVARLSARIDEVSRAERASATEHTEAAVAAQAIATMAAMREHMEAAVAAQAIATLADGLQHTEAAL